MALSQRHAREFKEFELTQIKPMGWLKKMLELQADGLTGHLDEIWPDVGPNSAWLGGNGEDWERGPYYCNGLVPLAYILDRPELKEKAQRWMGSVLESQAEEGFFGPKTNTDWWPRMMMLEALMSYHEATRDPRVISFMLKYFRYQLKELRSRPLEHWAWARGFENLVSIFWLYRRTKEDWLLDLAHLITEQALDWSALFEFFPYTHPTERYLPKEFVKKLGSYNGWKTVLEDPHLLGLSEEKVEKFFYIYHTTHVVNVAMALKEPALKYQLFRDERYRTIARKAIESLMKYHGQPNGIFSGDEHLNGRRTTQGTELCAVVEAMRSLEILFKTFGDPAYADQLETIAYNALPATIRPQFYAHQYDQQVNQVLCSVEPRDWYNNREDSNIFGLEPNFGCCTANMHQGWPKFVKHLWMKADEHTFVVAAYAPCVLTHSWSDIEHVEIVEDTEYPFDDNVEFFVSTSREISLMLRIPSWSKGATVALSDEETFYEAVPYAVVHIPKGKSKIKVHFHFEVEMVPWTDHSAFFRRGPLVFSLKIQEEWKKVRGDEPFADYEVYPKSDWAYALTFPNQVKLIKASSLDSTIPFHGAQIPIKLRVKAIKLNDWPLSNGSVSDPPVLKEPELKNPQVCEIDLVPYGWTTLRITEFPVVFLQGGSEHGRNLRDQV